MSVPARVPPSLPISTAAVTRREETMGPGNKPTGAVKMAGYTTPNVDEAALLAGLGFQTMPTYVEVLEARASERVEFVVAGLSEKIRLERETLWAQLCDGTLAAGDPAHPALVGWRALQAMGLLLKMLHGRGRYGVVEVLPGPVGGRCWRAVEGQPGRLPVGRQRCAVVPDLALVAALAVCGFEPLDVRDQGPGRRAVVLPVVGLGGDALLPLIRRVGPGQLDLQLERDAPEHPLVTAYNCTWARAQLMGAVRQVQHQVLLKAPGTDRRALVDLNASGRVMDFVRQHFGVI